MHQFGLIGSLTFAALACSCVGDLVLLNESDHPVVITLSPARGDSTDPACRCPDGFVHEQLGIAAALTDDELRRATWSPLEEDAFHIDSTGARRTMTVTVTLPPRTAFRIGRVYADCAGGIFGSDAPSSIEILGQERLTRLTAAEILAAFKPRTRYLYVYEIRP